jgi:hypothetical protein
MMAFPSRTLIPCLAMSCLGWRHRYCPGQEVEVCDEPALRLLGTEYLEDGIWRRDDDIMSKEGRIRQLHALWARSQQVSGLRSLFRWLESYLRKPVCSDW